MIACNSGYSLFPLVWLIIIVFSIMHWCLSTHLNFRNYITVIKRNLHALNMFPVQSNYIHWVGFKLVLKIRYLLLFIFIYMTILIKVKASFHLNRDYWLLLIQQINKKHKKHFRITAKTVRHIVVEELIWRGKKRECKSFGSIVQLWYGLKFPAWFSCLGTFTAFCWTKVEFLQKYRAVITGDQIVSRRSELIRVLNRNWSRIKAWKN